MPTSSPVAGLPVDEQRQIDENLGFCAQDGLWNDYFVAAEPEMEWQWNGIIWPAIQDADFSVTVEIGPGAGRNSVRLAELSGVLHVVDLNTYALDKTRARFAGLATADRVHFHQNDGMHLPFLAPGTATFVYSWDSMVHFDRLVIRSYLGEFATALASGGTGFIHHAYDGGNLAESAHARSNMSAALFREYCDAFGLEVTLQRPLD